MNLDLCSSHFAYDAVTSTFVRYLARRYHQNNATFLGDTSAKSHTNNKILPACLFTSHQCLSYCLLLSFYCPCLPPHGSTPHPAIRQPWRRIRYYPLCLPHNPLRSRHIRKPWRSMLAIVFAGNCQYPSWNNQEVSCGTAWILECQRGRQMFFYNPLYYIYRTVVLFSVLSNLLLLSLVALLYLPKQSPCPEPYLEPTLLSQRSADRQVLWDQPR